MPDLENLVIEAKLLLEDMTRPPSAALMEYAWNCEWLRMKEVNFLNNTAGIQSLGIPAQERFRIYLNFQIARFVFGLDRWEPDRTTTWEIPKTTPPENRASASYEAIHTLKMQRHEQLLNAIEDFRVEVQAR
jgi:hypothetical protein